MKADLPDHRKFLKLRRLLGEPTPHVLGYLLMMWRRCYQTGNPLLGDALDVEAAAEFGGEPGRFTKAAFDAGFLDRDDDGETYAVHDLWDHAPVWAKKRMDRNGHAPDGREGYAGTFPRGNENADPLSARKGGGKKTAAKRPARKPKRREERGERKEEKEEEILPADAGGDRPDPATASASTETTDTAPATGHGSETPATTRKRDPLFDALADVTGSDPKVSGGHIGRVRKLLAAADPPYTADEVRRFADPAFLARELPWTDGRKPTLGEVEKNVGRVRNPSAGQRPPPRRQTAADADLDYLADQFADAYGGPP